MYLVIINRRYGATVVIHRDELPKYPNWEVIAKASTMRLAWERAGK